MAEATYQSLYRRYRPQRFAEILGQDHVVVALRNAVREHKVSHAYLFSGPRGTGKTSAARILAKALNCEHPLDGEPDDSCDSCVRIKEGASLDVYELDAASNNGVDAMRDLVSRTALGTPGRWKVYIVDEVHMLSTAASNALLKTLEEPPAHVIFVLATTDPQKVLPTIRSRTQHFEFRLLSPETLGRLVHQINGSADLHVPEEALDLVVRRGRGSARDTLSALDQVAAAGQVDDESEVLDEITEALCERDAGRALVAVAEAMVSGRDAQRVAVDLLEHLRNGFLALMAKQLVALPDNAVEHIEEQARRLGPAAIVRALELVGEALQEMRDAPEPRVSLEVALVRLTSPQLDVDPAALLERIERLESRAGGASPVVEQSGTRPAPATTSARDEAETKPDASQQSQEETPVVPSAPSPSVVAPPPAARPSLGGLRRNGSAPDTAVSPASAAAPPAAPANAGRSRTPQPRAPMPRADLPPFAQLVAAWNQAVFEQLPQRVKSRFRMGNISGVEDGRVLFALPNAIHRDRCEEMRTEVEQALSQHFGRYVPMKLTVANEPASNSPTPTDAPPAMEYGQHDDDAELDDTISGEPLKVASPEERLLQAFPGAEEM